MWRRKGVHPEPASSSSQLVEKELEVFREPDPPPPVAQMTPPPEADNTTREEAEEGPGTGGINVDEDRESTFREVLEDDAHISSKNSQWLAENLEKMDRRVKEMLKLIQEEEEEEEEGNSLHATKKADQMYFQKRSELISRVEGFYSMYRDLAGRYGHVTGELRKSSIQSELRCHQGGGSGFGSAESKHDDSKNDDCGGLRRRKAVLVSELHEHEEKSHGPSHEAIENVEHGCLESTKVRDQLEKEELIVVNENCRVSEEEAVSCKLKQLKLEKIVTPNEVINLYKLQTAEQEIVRLKFDISRREHEMEDLIRNNAVVVKHLVRERDLLVERVSAITTSFYAYRTNWIYSISQRLPRIPCAEREATQKAIRDLLAERDGLNARVYALTQDVIYRDNWLSWMEERHWQQQLHLEHASSVISDTTEAAADQTVSMELREQVKELVEREMELRERLKELEEEEVERRKRVKDLERWERVKELHQEEPERRMELQEQVKELEELVERHKAVISDAAEGLAEALSGWLLPAASGAARDVEATNAHGGPRLVI